MSGDFPQIDFDEFAERRFTAQRLVDELTTIHVVFGLTRPRLSVFLRAESRVPSGPTLAADEHLPLIGAFLADRRHWARWSFLQCAQIVPKKIPGLPRGNLARQ